VRRDLLTTFHVSDPKQFNSSHDFWQVPDDPATQAGSTRAGKQPPYYMMLTQFPGLRTSRFQLTALTPTSRQNLSALLTGVLGADGRLKLELLELPREYPAPAGSADHGHGRRGDLPRQPAEARRPCQKAGDFAAVGTALNELQTAIRNFETAKTQTRLAIPHPRRLPRRRRPASPRERHTTRRPPEIRETTSTSSAARAAESASAARHGLNRRRVPFAGRSGPGR
jgi:uncharacterized membrane protein (UPF0182 family)